VGACPTPASRAQLLARVDRGGWTALHLVCNQELNEDAAVALAEVLLGAGADPRVRGAPRLHGPIHLAAQWSLRLVQRLVAAGVPIDGGVAGNSTLRSAAGAGTARGVRMIPALVALGARETGGDDLVRHIVDMPVGGTSPSDEEVRVALTALVSVGCSLTEPDEDGDSPMDVAALNGNASVVTVLLALGVAATTQSLAYAVKYPVIVRALLAAGAPPGLAAGLGAGAATVTPLMAAARASSLESVRLLLAAGASVNERGKGGCTALMYALKCDAVDSAAVVVEVVEALLDAGADVNARDTSTSSWAVRGTALHHLAARASQTWAVDVAYELLRCGADARTKNSLSLSASTPAECVPRDLRGSKLHRLLVEAAEAAAR
jgi:hypothetical protein